MEVEGFDGIVVQEKRRALKQEQERQQQQAVDIKGSKADREKQCGVLVDKKAKGKSKSTAKAKSKVPERFSLEAHLPQCAPLTQKPVRSRLLADSFMWISSKGAWKQHAKPLPRMSATWAEVGSDGKDAVNS